MPLPERRPTGFLSRLCESDFALLKPSLELVEVTRDVPDERRGAAFVCVLVLMDDSGKEHVFEGRCAGTLLREPQGGGGFGYDPIFVPEGKTVSYAQISEEEKNEISHRGRAWAQVREFLRQRRAKG